MANDALETLRNNLKSTLSDEWNEQDAFEFAGELAGEWDQDMRNEYRDCLNDDNDPISCLEDLAREDYGLPNEYRNIWENAPDDVVQALQQISGLWGPDARDAVENVVYDNDISELYQKCMQGDFNDVSDEIGVNFSNNFSDCADAVADVKDLSKDLKEVWGVGS